MASSGRLGAVDVTGGVNTTLYTVPSTLAGSIEVTVLVCNRNDSDVKIRVAGLDGAIATLSNEDYIEYDVTLKPHGVFERSGIDMARSEVLGVYSDKSNVTFQARAR